MKHCNGDKWSEDKYRKSLAYYNLFLNFWPLFLSVIPFLLNKIIARSGNSAKKESDGAKNTESDFSDFQQLQGYPDLYGGENKVQLSCAVRDYYYCQQIKWFK